MRLVAATDFSRQQHHFSQSLFYRRLSESCRLKASTSSADSIKSAWLSAESAWRRLADIPISLVPGVVLEAGEHCTLWIVK